MYLFFTKPQFTHGYLQSRYDDFIGYQALGLTKKLAVIQPGAWRTPPVTHGLTGMERNRIGVPVFHGGVHVVMTLFLMGAHMVEPRSASYHRLMAALLAHDHAMSSGDGISVSGQGMFHFIQS